MTVVPPASDPVVAGAPLSMVLVRLAHDTTRERITVGALPWVAPIYRCMPQVAEVMKKMTMVIEQMSPSAYQQFYNSEYDRWGSYIKTAKVTVDQ